MILASYPRSTLDDVVPPLPRPVKSGDGKPDVHEASVAKGTNVYVPIVSTNGVRRSGASMQRFGGARWLEGHPGGLANVRFLGVYPSM